MRAADEYTNANAPEDEDEEDADANENDDNDDYNSAASDSEDEMASSGGTGSGNANSTYGGSNSAGASTAARLRRSRANPNAFYQQMRKSNKPASMKALKKRSKEDETAPPMATVPPAPTAPAASFIPQLSGIDSTGVEFNFSASSLISKLFKDQVIGGTEPGTLGFGMTMGLPASNLSKKARKRRNRKKNKNRMGSSMVGSAVPVPYLASDTGANQMYDPIDLDAMSESRDREFEASDDAMYMINELRLEDDGVSEAAAVTNATRMSNEVAVSAIAANIEILTSAFISKDDSPENLNLKEKLKNIVNSLHTLQRVIDNQELFAKLSSSKLMSGGGSSDELSAALPAALMDCCIDEAAACEGADAGLIPILIDNVMNEDGVASGELGDEGDDVMNENEIITILMDSEHFGDESVKALSQLATKSLSYQHVSGAQPHFVYQQQPVELPPSPSVPLNSKKAKKKAKKAAKQALESVNNAKETQFTFEEIDLIDTAPASEQSKLNKKRAAKKKNKQKEKEKEKTNREKGKASKEAEKAKEDASEVKKSSTGAKAAVTRPAQQMTTETVAVEEDPSAGDWIPVKKSTGNNTKTAPVAKAAPKPKPAIQTVANSNEIVKVETVEELPVPKSIDEEEIMLRRALELSLKEAAASQPPQVTNPQPQPQPPQIQAPVQPPQPQPQPQPQVTKAQSKPTVPKPSKSASKTTTNPPRAPATSSLVNGVSYAAKSASNKSQAPAVIITPTPAPQPTPAPTLPINSAEEFPPVSAANTVPPAPPKVPKTPKNTVKEHHTPQATPKAAQESLKKNLTASGTSTKSSLSLFGDFKDNGVDREIDAAPEDTAQKTDSPKKPVGAERPIGFNKPSNNLPTAIVAPIGSSISVSASVAPNQTVQLSPVQVAVQALPPPLKSNLSGGVLPSAVVAPMPQQHTPPAPPISDMLYSEESLLDAMKFKPVLGANLMSPTPVAPSHSPFLPQASGYGFNSFAQMPIGGAPVNQMPIGKQQAPMMPVKQPVMQHKGLIGSNKALLNDFGAFGPIQNQNLRIAPNQMTHGGFGAQFNGNLAFNNNTPPVYGAPYAMNAPAQGVYGAQKVPFSGMPFVDGSAFNGGFGVKNNLFGGFGHSAPGEMLNGAMGAPGLVHDLHLQQQQMQPQQQQKDQKGLFIHK